MSLLPVESIGGNRLDLLVAQRKEPGLLEVVC